MRRNPKPMAPMVACTAISLRNLHSAKLSEPRRYLGIAHVGHLLCQCAEMTLAKDSAGDWLRIGEREGGIASADNGVYLMIDDPRIETRECAIYDLPRTLSC